MNCGQGCLFCPTDFGGQKKKKKNSTQMSEIADSRQWTCAVARHFISEPHLTCAWRHFSVESKLKRLIHGDWIRYEKNRLD